LQGETTLEQHLQSAGDDGLGDGFGEEGEEGLALLAFRLDVVADTRRRQEARG
jgi:hypothetical protein